MLRFCATCDYNSTHPLPPRCIKPVKRVCSSVLRLRFEDIMAEKKISVPDVLPVLPVRDTVLFPGAVLPLTVGRESSLALVNSLEGDEKLLAVVAQLDPRIEDPAAADLHKVGTVAKVHKTVKMPNGNVVVFLEGLQRGQVTELVTLRPYMRARVE